MRLLPLEPGGAFALGLEACREAIAQCKVMAADVFNALNSNAAVGATSNAGEPPAAINTIYSPPGSANSQWLKPLNILQARYVKFGAQLTF